MQRKNYLYHEREVWKTYNHGSSVFKLYVSVADNRFHSQKGTKKLFCNYKLESKISSFFLDDRI